MKYVSLKIRFQAQSLPLVAAARLHGDSAAVGRSHQPAVGARASGRTEQLKFEPAP